MALGLRDYHLSEVDPRSKDETSDQMKSILNGFFQEFGCRSCRELTGHDVGTPEGLQAFLESEAKQRCPLYVGWMCDRLGALLTSTK
jgi:hypothetical protein